jgi:hypothetical protein
MKRRDLILEVQSMIEHGGWQVAKSIVLLAEAPDGTCKMIGPSGPTARRRRLRKIWHTNEARRLVAAAKERIALVDEGET